MLRFLVLKIWVRTSVVDACRDSLAPTKPLIVQDDFRRGKQSVLTLCP